MRSVLNDALGSAAGSAILSVVVVVVVVVVSFSCGGVALFRFELFWLPFVMVERW